MSSLSDFLARWQDAGIIDRPTSERILAFENARTRIPEGGDSRPGALEALLYLGLVVLGVGAFSLLAQNWGDLESWARVMVLGIPFLLVTILGAVLVRNGNAQLQRGSQASWLLAVALFAGLLAVTFNEYGLGFSEQDERGWLLIAGVATLLFASALWVLNPAHAQVLAVAGSAFFLGQAVGDWPDEYSRQLAGTTILVAGAAGVALAEAGWFTPQTSARLFFSALLIIGPFEAGLGDGSIWFELAAGVAAAGAIGLGVFRGDFSLVLLGVAGAFVVLVSFIFEHFQDRLGAPLALMVSGGILVAAVLLLAVLRRETREQRTQGSS